MNVESKALEKLNISPGGIETPLFSPDGKKICYTVFDEGKWYNILEILFLETGEVTCPVAAIDENISVFRWIEKGILIGWREKTNSCIGLVTEQREITPLVFGEDCVAMSPSISKNGRHLFRLC